MDKQERLKELEAKMRSDGSLPLKGSNLVFGEGDVDSEVMFIGEAPGKKEDELRRPFVGRAGQLLNRLIEQIGWRREGVYITNIVKRRPPENRDPTPDEIEAYKPYLARHIAIIQPVVIAPLGRFSMNYFLPEAKITRDQGRVFKAGQYFVVPLFHPAAALRAGEVMEKLEASFKKLPAIVAACKNYAPGEKKGGSPLPGVSLPPSRAPKDATRQEKLF
jgi:DNA polymerase